MDDTYKVSMAPVMQAKIPPGDPRWPAFNGSFENQTLSAANVAAMLYDGHPITTWHKNHWRASANYIMGQHIGIDFDTEDKRSTIATLKKDPLIAHHAAILYTTPSHTPDKPRARVIFLLDTPIHQSVNYTMAASAMLWMFGSADRQCKDAVRFFYGGRPGACEMEFLANVLPLEKVRQMIATYQATGRQQAKRMMAGATFGAPDQQRVADALKTIDPWAIDYDQWLAVLMAIHSEFPSEDGLSMAEQWGQGKDNEVAQKWRSFHTTGGVGGKVGIGTVFAIAQQRGWKPS